MVFVAKKHLDSLNCVSLQRARTRTGAFSGENLSPRSRRLMNILPKPKSYAVTVGLNLNRVQTQITEDLDKMEQVQALISSFIKEYFERISPEKVPFLLAYLNDLPLMLLQSERDVVAVVGIHQRDVCGIRPEL